MLDKFKIKQTIMLGFITDRNQGDLLITPEDGYTLESDGSTIWVVSNNDRKESITMAHAIKLWLEQGKIEEIGDSI